MNQLLKQLDIALSNYGLIIAIAILSFTFGFFFKEYISDRHYRKQITLRFLEKDERINDLKQIIQERAKKLSVEKADPDLFRLWKKIVKYFKPK